MNLLQRIFQKNDAVDDGHVLCAAAFYNHGCCKFEVCRFARKTQTICAYYKPLKLFSKTLVSQMEITANANSSMRLLERLSKNIVLDV